MISKVVGDTRGLYTRHGFSSKAYSVSTACTAINDQLLQQTSFVSAKCIVGSGQLAQQALLCQFRLYCHKLPAGVAGTVSLQSVLP
jgi:hypothetical protein